jgi:tRNA uridine 5-carbamoylmethylation protein Kti12
MPLVIMCGHPSSGKTTRAAALAKHLSETAAATVIVVNLEGLKIDKNVMFDSKHPSTVQLLSLCH